MRGTVCPTARTASRRTLPPSAPAAANPLPRRPLSHWTLNGIASASGERETDKDLGGGFD